MSGKLTRHAYEQLVAEDIEWLKKQPRTLERDHIIAICERSATHEYECESLRRENEYLWRRVHEENARIAPYVTKGVQAAVDLCRDVAMKNYFNNMKAALDAIDVAAIIDKTLEDSSLLDVELKSEAEADLDKACATFVEALQAQYRSKLRLQEKLRKAEACETELRAEVEQLKKERDRAQENWRAAETQATRVRLDAEAVKAQLCALLEECRSELNVNPLDHNKATRLEIMGRWNLEQRIEAALAGRGPDSAARLRAALEELVDIVQGHLDDGDRLDSFTLQPAREALAGCDPEARDSCLACLTQGRHGEHVCVRAEETRAALEKLVKVYDPQPTIHDGILGLDWKSSPDNRQAHEAWSAARAALAGRGPEAPNDACVHGNRVCIECRVVLERAARGAPREVAERVREALIDAAARRYRESSTEWMSIAADMRAINLDSLLESKS